MKINQAIKRLLRPILLKTSLCEVENFEPKYSYAEHKILASVQNAGADELNLGNIDHSTRYIKVHTLPIRRINLNDLLIVDGATYKVISVTDNSFYGYIKAVGEEVAS